MEFTIIIGGKAGDGVAKTAEILGEVFTHYGLYVFNYRDYPSLIRGGHNFNVLSVSDEPIYSHESKANVLICMDENTREKHEDSLKSEGFIIGSKDLETDEKFIGIDLEEIISKEGIKEVMENTILLGALFKGLGLKLKDGLLEVLKEEFGDYYEGNEKAAELGYENSREIKELEIKKKGSNYFLTGTQATGLGAIKSGLDVYLAYPMTPATGLLHFLASKQEEYDFITTQLENEIAVANATMGASYTGAVSMMGTSGGGFGLMSPITSFQGISEIPLVLYWAQRTGPGLGLPTYQTQGDLRFSRNPAQGDFPKVVIAPGDPMEAYNKTVEAFYLSQKYRMLSILLTDKHLVESHFTHDELRKPGVEVERNIVENPDKDEKLYELTKDGLSPRVVPGQKALAKATSYEHDEYGYTIEEPELTAEMNDKRFRKFKTLKEEVKGFETVKTYGEGDNLIIGWGSTKGAIRDAIKELENVKFLQVIYLSPFPKGKVRNAIEKADKTILVENNKRGQLGNVIREETGLEIDEKVLKYNGRPFTKDGLVEKLKEVLK